LRRAFYHSYPAFFHFNCAGLFTKATPRFSLYSARVASTSPPHDFQNKIHFQILCPKERKEYKKDGIAALLLFIDKLIFCDIILSGYRGFCYDEEIELYYLQSRYYDPSIGRFINEDATPQISFVASDAITSNMYSYCSNSPSNMCDESGFYGITFKIMSSIVSAFSGAYIGAAVATCFGLKGWKKALCIVGGAALMGLVGWLFPLANLYAAVKGTLYAAGCSYLSIKGYSVALMAYHHGMWGAGYSLSSNQKQKFISKIKAS